jgi:hypothetical protein
MFDLPGQFTLLNNMGALNTELSNNANGGFGNNRFFDYKLGNNIATEPDSIQPYYYVDINNDANFKHFVYSDDPLVTLPQIQYALTNYFNILSNQSMVLIGNTQVDAIANLLNGMTSQKFAIAQGSNG